MEAARHWVAEDRRRLQCIYVYMSPNHIMKFFLLVHIVKISPTCSKEFIRSRSRDSTHPNLLWDDDKEHCLTTNIIYLFFLAFIVQRFTPKRDYILNCSYVSLLSWIPFNFNLNLPASVFIRSLCAYVNLGAEAKVNDFNINRVE